MAEHRDAQVQFNPQRTAEVILSKLEPILPGATRVDFDVALSPSHDTFIGVAVKPDEAEQVTFAYEWKPLSGEVRAVVTLERKWREKPQLPLLNNVTRYTTTFGEDGRLEVERHQVDETQQLMLNSLFYGSDHLPGDRQRRHATPWTISAMARLAAIHAIGK